MMTIVTTIRATHMVMMMTIRITWQWKKKTCTIHSSTSKQATSTLQLRQKAKRDKLAELCRYFNVTKNLDSANYNRLNHT